ncbi:hypothetical protein WJX84_001361, partial [Apatococcus fuscideae]
KGEGSAVEEAEEVVGKTVPSFERVFHLPREVSGSQVEEGVEEAEAKVAVVAEAEGVDPRKTAEVAAGDEAGDAIAGAEGGDHQASPRQPRSSMMSWSPTS